MSFQPIRKILLASALVVGSAAASASSFTYDFTGFVQANFFGPTAPFAVGTPVSGSFTLDYDAAIPGQGSGPFGSQTDIWSVSSNGVPSALVFSATVNIGGTILSTNPISQFGNESSIVGNGGSLTAGTTIEQDAHNSFELDYALNVPDAYSSDGSLRLPVDLRGEGSYITNHADGQQEITLWAFSSITPAPVPLPAAAWLLMSGLGSLAAIGKGRRSR